MNDDKIFEGAAACVALLHTQFQMSEIEMVMTASMMTFTLNQSTFMGMLKELGVKGVDSDNMSALLLKKMQENKEKAEEADKNEN